MEEREVLAWRMASSLVAGGLGDEREHLGEILDPSVWEISSCF